MKKYIVKECYNLDNQNYFDDLIFDLTENYFNDVFIGGNRNFNEYNFSVIHAIEKEIIDYCDYDLIPYKNNFALYCLDIIKKYKSISFAQACKVAKAVKNTENLSKTDLIVKILNIVYCGDFENTTLTGYCQGDYIYCFYNKKTIKYDFIQYIEGVFFNTGKEIYISENKHEITKKFNINNFVYNGYFAYIVDYFFYKDKLKAISEIIGCNIDEIAFFEIKDVKEIKSYKIEYSQAQ